MDNQNPKMQHYTPKKVADTYYQLDTTTLPNRTADIPALNGRQNDNARIVPLAFTDGDQPHNLTNTTIELRVLDAAGYVKVTDKVENLMDPQGGLVMFSVPQQVYQSPGTVQRAYFVLKDKTPSGEEQQISTINVCFTVLEDGIDISKQQSQIYISALDKVIGSAQNIITAGADNHFTGSNVIDTLTVKKLVNDDVDTLKEQVSSESTAISNVNDRVSSNATDISTLSQSISNVQDVAQSGIASASTNSNNIYSISNAVSQASQSLTALSDKVKTLPTSMPSVETKDYSDDIQSVADDLSDAVDSVASLSKAVNKVSGVDSLTNYSIAVNSVMTSTVSQAVHDFIVQYDTNSAVYGDSALSFIGKFLQSMQTQYTQNIGNIH